MPLVKGKKASSKEGFSENVSREIHAGKKKEQAVAIAYSEARKGKKNKPGVSQMKKHKEEKHEEHEKKAKHLKAEPAKKQMAGKAKIAAKKK